jgi:hypothetical protein
MSILQKLTEGVQSRDMQAEGAALLNKWEATGLLEGLDGESRKQGMAVLLENQAKELLREASSMAAGDVEGFAAVAFPIVRRVFGGLIANDLVSVQPMSLPSGLIFFLDFTHEGSRAGAMAGKSLYGGDRVGSQITGGVNLARNSSATGPLMDGGGHYDFGHAMSAPTASASLRIARAYDMGAGLSKFSLSASAVSNIKLGDTAFRKQVLKAIRYDADLLASGDTNQIAVIQVSGAAIDAASGQGRQLDKGLLSSVQVSEATLDGRVIRRLTQIDENANLTVVLFNTGAAPVPVPADTTDVSFTFAIKDELRAGGAIGSIVGGEGWGLEEPQISTGNVAATGSKNTIAEIDIKVDSIAVTAQTRKLKAKWSPELGQDLNAYHNLDAEVELTGILSEQIALEIDRELLGELVQGATAGTRYWSRAPGLFVDSNGNEVGASSAAPDFTGTVSEWYETLIETINDVSAQIHRKTLRGGANFVVCSPEVANILEFTSGFRAAVTADQDRGTIGALRTGSLSKKFDVYVDPYFLRNVVLIGRKGSSFLESGFVYAPYVPLQVTPTIFGTEDFVPRKGVMTRYAKKMVRPDMYGLVVVRGLLGEAGATS